MKLYLRIIAIFYFFGAIIHVMDVFSLRLIFSELSNIWKFWIIFLLIADTFAAVALWKQKTVGEYVFLFVAGIQLVVYSFFTNHFGNQRLLIIFHLLTVSIYFFLKMKFSEKQK